jgi:hypothetical protein
MITAAYYRVDNKCCDVVTAILAILEAILVLGSTILVVLVVLQLKGITTPFPGPASGPVSVTDIITDVSGTGNQILAHNGTLSLSPTLVTPGSLQVSTDLVVDDQLEGTNASFSGSVSTAALSATKATLTGELTGTTASFSGALTASSLTLNTALPPGQGGTGLTALGGEGTILESTGSGAQWVNPSTVAVVTVSGTSSQVSVSQSAGVVTLSLPNPLVAPGNLTVPGYLTCNNTATFLAPVSGTSASFSGSLSADGISSTGSVSGTTGSFSSSIASAGASFSSEITGTSASFSSSVSAEGISSDGPVSGTSASFSGAVSTGALTSSSLQVEGALDTVNASVNDTLHLKGPLSVGSSPTVGTVGQMLLSNGPGASPSWAGPATSYLTTVTLSSAVTATTGSAVTVLTASVTTPDYGNSWRLFVSYFMPVTGNATGASTVLASVSTTGSTSTDAFAITGTLAATSAAYMLSASDYSTGTLNANTAAVLTLSIQTASENVTVDTTYFALTTQLKVLAMMAN